MTVKPIVEFVHVLRGLGIRVSTSEMLDAAEALLSVEWSNRKQFKTALQATLVKQAADLPVFNEAFDAYFSDWEQQQHFHSDYEACLVREQELTEKATAELTFQGQSLELSQELKLVYAGLAPDDQQRIRSFLTKTSTGANVQAQFQPMAEKLVTGALEYWRRHLADTEERSYPVNYSGDSQLDAVMKAAANNLNDDIEALLYKDIRQIPPENIPLMLQLIKRLTSSLARQISRRQRQSNRVRRLEGR